jgi:hypothetical protein
MPKFQVPAECHSDDHYVECKFDAAPYLKKANQKTILALAWCGWGGDYPADNVALQEAISNREVEYMLKYIETRNKGKEQIGFECHINPTAAETWLKKNKPKLYAHILAWEF